MIYWCICYTGILVCVYIFFMLDHISIYRGTQRGSGGWAAGTQEWQMECWYAEKEWWVD